MRFFFFPVLWGAQPVLVPCGPGLNLGIFPFAMSAVVQCPRTLAVHFPSTVYRSAGSAQVLPDFAKSLDIANVQCIQFVPNGIVRVTFKESVQCDAALASGVSFRGSKLRVSAVDARTRLVYVRDLPPEVPDEPVCVFLRQYFETGTCVAKVTVLKDLPSSVRIAGSDVRLWYLGQPQSCPVCRQFGYRVRDCPLNGLCRQCRQPAPAVGVDPSVSADEEEDLDYVYFSASESDVVSDEEEAVDARS